MRASGLLIVGCLFFCCSVNLAKADTYALPRADQSEMTYYFDAPRSGSFPIVVLLQGSECSSIWHAHQRIKPWIQKLNIGLLGVEKYGISALTTSCPQEYLANNSISQRISDYLTAVSALRRTVSSWDHRIVWAGSSEGGTVASLVSNLVPETVATVLFASGGGLTMQEELLLLTQRGMEKSGATQSEIDRKIKELEAQFLDILNNPSPLKTWLGDTNTYLWWASILRLKTMRSLEQMEAPIYLAHGTIDQSVPVESADLVSKHFHDLGKTNLTYVRYPGLDHHWQDKDGSSHGDEVQAQALRWLQSILRTPSP